MTIAHFDLLNQALMEKQVEADLALAMADKLVLPGPASVEEVTAPWVEQKIAGDIDGARLTDFRIENVHAGMTSRIRFHLAWNDAGVAAQPVALRFLRDGVPTNALAQGTGEGFFASFVRVLGERGKRSGPADGLMTAIDTHSHFYGGLVDSLRRRDRRPHVARDASRGSAGAPPRPRSARARASTCPCGGSPTGTGTASSR